VRRMGERMGERRRGKGWRDGGKWKEGRVRMGEEGSD